MTIERLAELFQKAEDAFLGGAYDEAINNYKKTIEINPSFHDAYFNLAIAYTKTNQIENAIKILERVICLCPDDASVYNNLGVLCFKKNMYLDAKTYFEIALLLHDTYKEARENLDKVDKILKETSIAKKTNHTIGLIFSKDRAMQLDATLRSFYMHCGDAHLLDLKVIYKTSHAVHERQYEDLKKDYDNVEFIREENFKEQVLSLIRKYTFVLFLVDDNIFLRNFCISDLTKSLNENTNSIGFSLRLGENTVYCYALHSSQNSPAFTHIKSDFLKYDWTSAGLDFGYPLEVSSSLYRVKEIYTLLVQINFSNPNTLEGQMAANKQVYIKTRPTLLCSKLSLTFCAPLNMVQDVCNNRAGSENCYSSEMLVNKFGEGYRIAVEKYIGFTPNACHQEVPLDFKFKTMNPAVSVIIPCYNQAHYLPEAVASVVNQTFTDWECIIVNDGSSDNTSQVAILLISKYPNNKIRLINQENKGLAEARNNGIEVSTGKYILPLDADDLIHPEMLQKTVSLLEKYQEIAIAYTDVKHFGLVDKIDYAGEYNFKRLCTQNHLNYCSLYRREAWKATGGYNRNMTWGYEDWDFWIACGERGFYGKRIPEPLFMYRVKESSMYTKALEHHSELMSQIIINHPNLYDQKYIAEAKNILAQCSAEKIKTNPLVSVIVPTYNRPDTLKTTLDSIAVQTYKNIETIVVNDAGEDVSGVIDTFHDRLSIKYIVHDKNKGLAAARNTAIKAAGGKYIAYLDDDDIFYPDHLETLVNLLEASDYKVAYTDAYRAHQEKVNDTYITRKKDVPYSFDFDYDRILMENYIPVLCFMHEKSCLEKVGMFDETLRSLEDWDLWMRMSREFQFAHIRKITCEFSWRLDGSTMTIGKKDEMDDARKLVLSRGIKLYRDKQKHISELHSKAKTLFENGAYPEAIDAYKKAITASYYPNKQLQPEETARLFDAYCNLALSYVNTEKPDEAIAAFQKAVELNNSDATVYNNLGVLYFKNKLYNDARSCFEKALSLDNHYAEAQQNLKKVSGVKDIHESETTPLTKEAVDKQVSIIILTWNALDYTKKCIISIQNHTTYPHEIIFVDNASTDGTVEYLLKMVKEHPNYKLLENQENKGFAAGNNQGVKIAGGEYIMLLNNDVIVSEGWLEGLVESLKRDEKIGMVGPITNSISGRQMITHVPYSDEGGFHIFSQKIRKLRRGILTPRYRIAGFAALMRKVLYEEVGGLDESFGIGNYEDDDLCLKVRGKGYAIMVDESVYIHHYRSQTFIDNKIDYQNSIAVNDSKFRQKWPEVDYEELLELHGSLTDTNASLVSEGRQALESGNTHKAIELFSKVVNTNPIDDAALCGLGLACQTTGEIDKAVNAYRKVIEIHSCSQQIMSSGNGSYLFDAYYNLALLYASINQTDNAISLFEKVAAMQFNDVSLYNNLGVLYFRKKMHDDARRCFEKALAIDVNYAEAQQNLEKIFSLKNS